MSFVERLAVDIADPESRPPRTGCARLNLEPDRIERGVLKLVLALVELLRQVMEKQAMRRIDAGQLTTDEIDRLGRSLMTLESTVASLQAQFAIDDLNIDLGPAGCLLDSR
jgi:hypothetical protein